jgi:hypothetical protein
MLVSAIHFLRRQGQDRFEQADARIADGKLRGVNSHCQAAGARCVVIAQQGALAPLVELALLCQGQRDCGDNKASLQELMNVRVDFRRHGF